MLRWGGGRVRSASRCAPSWVNLSWWMWQRLTQIVSSSAFFAARHHETLAWQIGVAMSWLGNGRFRPLLPVCGCQRTAGCFVIAVSQTERQASAALRSKAAWAARGVSRPQIDYSRSGLMWPLRLKSRALSWGTWAAAPCVDLMSGRLLRRLLTLVAQQTYHRIGRVALEDSSWLHWPSGRPRFPTSQPKSLCLYCSRCRSTA